MHTSKRVTDLFTHSVNLEHCCVLVKTRAAFSALTVRHTLSSGCTVFRPRKAPVSTMPKNSKHFILVAEHHLRSGLHSCSLTVKHVGHLRPLDLNSPTSFSSRSLIVISQETGARWGWGKTREKIGCLLVTGKRNTDAQRATASWTGPSQLVATAPSPLCSCNPQGTRSNSSRSYKSYQVVTPSLHGVCSLMGKDAASAMLINATKGSGYVMEFRVGLQCWGGGQGNPR